DSTAEEEAARALAKAEKKKKKDGPDGNGKKKKKKHAAAAGNGANGSADEEVDGRASSAVAKAISKRLGIETPATVLGPLQRGGVPPPTDRILATRFGTYAAELLAQGTYNQMVCLKGGEVSSVPIEQVAGRVKLVPLDHPLLRAARRVGTNFGD